MGNAFSIPFLQKRTVPKVLFLTTEPPETIKAEWPFYQNWFLPQTIRERGAVVELRCWRNPDLDAASVSTYNSITFLWCNDYHQHPEEFPKFVRNVLVPAQRLNPSVHIFNDPTVVLWNTDKHYLLELAEAGYRVPRSKFVDIGQHTHASLKSVIDEFSDSKPLVLKPAISGSARNTHLIQIPRALTPDNIAFLDRILTEGSNGDLILQQYEEGISSGEYSLIFVNGKHTHTILKVPQAGEYRCQGEYGGSTAEIAVVDVPRCATEAAQDLWKFLESKVEKSEKENKIWTGRGLVYARIDGIIKDDAFILMEIEAIEPHLWLEANSGGEALEQLCRVFFPNRAS
ncbi:MAG: hypothetical protein ALECFALPRED_008110 [Alectoria fallacina]|uniref:Prokaryotic glutathione synthetase ATP-binding domain-containing protein n=1 Tax=Alectoria fallacina TaxID=1903189 RepID=A0A8H3IBL8_9LECA|nr:MAG: hypothetical protein ALECFALPRED_008110 [Alectoria fallacina]